MNTNTTAAGYYLSWTHKGTRQADTTEGTIESLPMAAAMATNLQRLQGYTKVQVVEVGTEEEIVTVTAAGIFSKHETTEGERYF